MARRAPREPVDTGVGRVDVVTLPAHPTARALVIDGNLHGTVDLAEHAELHLPYQARLCALVERLLPSDPAHVVHLGGGAFAIPRALAARRAAAAAPALQQTVIERSGAIIRLAHERLGLPRDQGGLHVRKGDARAQLRRLSAGGADLIVGDAFRGLKTPRHLLTVEFAHEVSTVLTPRGRYVVNLVDEPPFSLLGAQAATLGRVFPNVDAVADRGVARLRDPGNVFVVAGRTSLDGRALSFALSTGPHPSVVVPRGRLQALARVARVRSDADG